MKTTLALAAAAFAFAAPLSAQTEAAAAPAPMDKVSYFIGSQIGGNIANNFKQQGIEVDLENFLQAVRDKFEGKPSKFTEDELTAAMESFEKVMQAKAEAAMTPEERQEMAKQREAELAAMQERENKAKEAKVAGAKFLAENGKREGVVTTASGLQYEVLKKSDGSKPSVTDQVKVHYHGTLLDGTVFDSSVNNGRPITFGVQEVIKGWTEALQLMSIGSKFKLFIPSDLAYGERGTPGGPIGPDETLIFEVELLGIEK